MLFFPKLVCFGSEIVRRFFNHFLMYDLYFLFALYLFVNLICTSAAAHHSFSVDFYQNHSLPNDREFNSLELRIQEFGVHYLSPF